MTTKRPAATGAAGVPSAENAGPASGPVRHKESLTARILSPAASRYEAAESPVKHAGWMARLEDMMRQAATRAGRPGMEPSGRLDAAAADLAAWLPEQGTPPLDLVEFALRHHGMVEPAPHLLIAYCPGSPETCLDSDLASRLPSVLAEGKYNRVGIGHFAQAGRARLVIALGESYVRLRPIARRIGKGSTVEIRGEIEAPFRNAEVMVTLPQGVVQHLGRGHARSPAAFDVRLACQDPAGPYKIEVTGDDSYGAQVLANFPVYCGVAPPEEPPVATAAASVPRTPEAAERRGFDLLNADRAQGGRPTLLWDDALAAVARAHSADMQEHDFVGHISPRTGSAMDRVRRAGLAPPLVLENVVRAYSPEEAERGLMESPGHRANILSAEATQVGIGVVFGREVAGQHELFVTQVFTRKAAAIAPGEAARGVLALIQARRKRAGRAALASDSSLAQAAAEFSRAVAEGKAQRNEGQKATARGAELAGPRFFELGAWFAELPEVAALPEGEALLGAALTHVGVGVAVGRSVEMGEGTLFVTVIVGRARK